MRLPILQARDQPTEDDLVRYFHRTELQWCRQLAEDETQLDVGVALSNSALSSVWDANQVLDAALPDGLSPADAVAEVSAHFASRQSRCAKWVMNPALPHERTAPLAEYLRAGGYQPSGFDILYLTGMPSKPVREVAGLTIIPARASFRHARALAEESWKQWMTPGLVDATMLHLEDPQSDSWLALKDGRAVAIVTVQATGEIGCIEDLFVSQEFRGQGIGRTMMSRALEVCARALFRHVFIGVDPANAPANALYRQLGFARVGRFSWYRAPEISAG